MKDKLSAEEYKEIEQLVDFALAAPNKKEAQKFINKLQAYGYSLCGNTNNILNELICCAQEASGGVADKERKESFVKSTLYKLKRYGVE
ncbi:MAG: hypothetical protein NC094_04805 [Bacteroidales bacterium]|nr:hypothetical protein [Bacteroidales bacterium]